MKLSMLSLRAFALALAALAAVASAQGSGDPSVRRAGQTLLDDAGLFDATVQVLDDLPAEAGEAFSFPLWINGSWHEVSAWPHSLRAPGYRLMVQDGSGGYVEHPAGPSTSYRGEVSDFPDSAVALTLFEGQVRGTMRLGGDLPLMGVQPVSELYLGTAQQDHVVYFHSDVIPTDATCAGGLDVRQIPGSGGAPAADGGPGDAKVCEIAIDSDFEFYQSNGSSVASTQNDITTVMNSVENVYDNHCQITYDITVIYVETSEPDPYGTTSSSGLLNAFQNHWNSQHSADPRDTAHLFTGKNLSGSVIGIAYLNVICNKSSAYGLSQSKFSFSLTSRMALTAHELGHNWNAGHCDSTTCYIMCSGIGGCGPISLFAPVSINAITNKKAQVGCLTDPPPPAPPIIFNITPNTAEAFPGDTFTITGFFLSGVTSVNVGAASTGGVTIVSDTEIVVGSPTAPALGAVSVTAVNDAGVSNPLTVTIVETDPPRLNATGLGLTGLGFSWNFGAGGSDLWYLLVSIDDPTTFSFLGSNILLNSFLVSSGTLSGAGIGFQGIIVPPGASGATIYSQIVTLDGGTPSFDGVSNIAVSTILL